MTTAETRANISAAIRAAIVPELKAYRQVRRYQRAYAVAHPTTSDWLLATRQHEADLVKAGAEALTQLAEKFGPDHRAKCWYCQVRGCRNHDPYDAFSPRWIP